MITVLEQASARDNGANPKINGDDDRYPPPPNAWCQSVEHLAKVTAPDRVVDGLDLLGVRRDGDLGYLANGVRQGIGIRRDGILTG